MPLRLQVRPAPAPAIRVMVVDDSIVVRGVLSRWLAEEPGLQVVGVCRNGHEALARLPELDPDVVVLDIEMPELDGLQVLPLLLQEKPELTVIIASRLTRRNAEVGLKALTLGAKDYLRKPERDSETASAEGFRRELLQKIRVLGRSGPAARGDDTVLELEPGTLAAPRPSFSLRPFSPVPPRVIAIGSSTGGPQALQRLIASLGPVLDRLPILIVQHMPPTFTTILAEHLEQIAHYPAQEALHGQIVAPGHIYVAPGGRHMRVERKGSLVRIALGDEPPIHFCKPAVDPLFSSAAEAFGNGVLAVILTGMGVDGAAGAARIAGAGGSVIAQDETTSVVWGMPGAAAHANVCSAVLPLDEIGPRIIRLLTGEMR